MHIEEQVLKKFQNGTLATEELIEVLKHMEACSFCTNRLMEIEDEEIIQAPSYLKEDILKRVHKADVQDNIHVRKLQRKQNCFSTV